MQKKIRYFLLAGLFLFFASTGVAWAETCEVPTDCDTDSGWHIQLLEVTQQSTEYCNEILGIEECYRWRYQVYNQDGTTVGLTQLLFTIPTLCGVQPLFAGDEANPSLYPPGDGDPTSGFGKDIESISVARFEPNSSGGFFSFYSPEKTMTEATVAVAVKKGDGSCLIGGPSHYGTETNEEPFTVSSEQIITTSDGERFWIVEDIDTQCIKEAYEVNEDGTKGRLLTQELIEINLYSKAGLEPGADGNPLEYVGLTNQKCNRSIAKSKGPNTWYFISGRWMWR